jgi:hypothetical protein
VNGATPNEAHVLALALRGMPDPAHPAGMPQGQSFAERVRMRNVRIRTRQVCRLHFVPASHVELRR